MVYLAIKWVDLSMAMLVITRGYMYIYIYNGYNYNVIIHDYLTIIYNHLSVG